MSPRHTYFIDHICHIHRNTPYFPSFLSEMRRFLTRKEAYNNLLLGILANIEDPAAYNRFHLFMVREANQKGYIVSAALCTPPWPILVTGEESSEAVTADASLALAQHVIKYDSDTSENEDLMIGVKEVNGSATSSTAFADAFLRLHPSQSKTLRFRQGVYELTPYNLVLLSAKDSALSFDVRRVEDLSDPKTKEQHVLLNIGFHKDTGMLTWLDSIPDEETKRKKVEEVALRFLSRATSGTTVSVVGSSGVVRDRRLLEHFELLYSKEGAEPFVGATATLNAPTPNGVRIGYVYTPYNLRGQGLASVLVSRICENVFKRDEGIRAVFLFTDLSNPTSNSIYRKIGFKQVGEYLHYSLA